MKRLRSKLTYANVVSTLCLFLLLGGTAYATLSLPKNSVGSKQLKPNSVTGNKVKQGTIAASDLSSGALKALIPVTPYSKTESDARYLRSTIAEVKSFKNSAKEAAKAPPRKSPVRRATRRSAAVWIPPTRSMTESPHPRRRSKTDVQSSSSAKENIRRDQQPAGSARSPCRAPEKSLHSPSTRSSSSAHRSGDGSVHVPGEAVRTLPTSASPEIEGGVRLTEAGG